LFGRASNWYWQQGLWQDAIDHAFAAGDHKLAMQQLEVVWPGQRATASEQLLLDWCNRFSANQLAQSPLLCAYYGLALLASDFARGQLLLNEAQATATPAMGVEHGIVAIGQAYIAAAMGESQRALQQVQWARQQLPAAEQVWRGAAAALCGITHWQQGQLNAAVPEMQRAIAHMDQSNDISASISTRYLLGDIYLQQGNLLALERVLQAGLDRLEGGTGTAPQGAADLYVLQAELLYERDEPALALAALEAASAQGEQAKLAESQHRWHLLMARLQLAAGEWDLAAEQLALAQALQQPSPVPDWQPLAAWQLRLNLRRQRLPVAAEVVAGNTLEVETDATTGVAITAANLFEQITLCQQQLLGLGLESGSGASEAEAGVLQQRLMALGSYARQLGLYPRQLEAELLLVALGLLTRDSAAAGRLLADAVAIMRGRRLLRPLLDLILPAAIYSEFHHLLPADLRRRWSLPELTSDAHSQAPPPVLLEPLSEREQEVLHWYASDLSGPQIAEQLYISMNTLRTHSKNIYTKLGVNNRRAAVSLGRQHGLI
jgi:LuxR family maltose regulon positive regulatory protein